MRVNDTQIEMSNYSEFKSSVGRFGLSNNNFYEVVLELQPSSPLYIELLKVPNLNISEVNNLMRIYTDEASLPGIQISTGEYRINNTPTLKYGYGAVFSEISLSFLLDADARIKSVFDASYRARPRLHVWASYHAPVACWPRSEGVRQNGPLTVSPLWKLTPR